MQRDFPYMTGRVMCRSVNSSVLWKCSVTLPVPLPRWRHVYLSVRTCSA